jgi:hypothetical protein
VDHGLGHVNQRLQSGIEQFADQYKPYQRHKQCGVERGRRKCSVSGASTNTSANP